MISRLYNIKEQEAGQGNRSANFGFSFTNIYMLLVAFAFFIFPPVVFSPLGASFLVDYDSQASRMYLFAKKPWMWHGAIQQGLGSFCDILLIDYSARVGGCRQRQVLNGMQDEVYQYFINE